MKINKINYISLVLMIILCVYLIFFPLRHSYSFAPFVVSVGIFSILLLLNKKIGLTNRDFIILNIGLWINLMGELYFYYNFQYYDKVLHFINPLLLTWFLINYYKENDFKLKYVIIFLTVLGISGSMEIIEYLVDKFTNFPVMGVVTDSGKELLSKIDDTMWDMICGALGSLSYLFFYKLTKNKSIEFSKEITIHCPNYQKSNN